MKIRRERKRERWLYTPGGGRNEVEPVLCFPVESHFHRESAICWLGGAGQLVLWIRPPQSRDRLLPNTRVLPSPLTPHHDFVFDGVNIFLACHAESSVRLQITCPHLIYGVYVFIIKYILERQIKMQNRYIKIKDNYDYIMSIFWNLNKSNIYEKHVLVVSFFLNKSLFFKTLWN